MCLSIILLYNKLKDQQQDLFIYNIDYESIILL